MNKIKRIMIPRVVFFVILFLLSHTAVKAADDRIEKIEEYVEQITKEEKIPGISVVITDKEDSYIMNKGIKRVGLMEEITEDTLFEIGSSSKAFTALGILYLEKKGWVNLEDSITQYIPWLTIYDWDGEGRNKAEYIKIKHLLNHTSGIPYVSMFSIKNSKETDALKNTGFMLKQYRLMFEPGTRMEYSSVNYDLLGLIIESVTKEPFEAFMRERILKPLGLENTFVLGNIAKTPIGMASGHKYSFLVAMKYDAPVIDGNVPAAYFVSSAADLKHWIEIQLGFLKLPKFYEELIERSHETDLLHGLDDAPLYLAGWEYEAQQERDKSNGNNPSFSSSIYLERKNGVGVGVLLNINRMNVENIAVNILDIWEGREVKQMPEDIMCIADKIFVLVSTCLLLMCLFLIYVIIKKYRLIKAGEAIKREIGFISIIITVISGMVLILIQLGILFLPSFMVPFITWEVIALWVPYSLISGVLLFSILCILVFLYKMELYYFPKKRIDKKI